MAFNNSDYDEPTIEDGFTSKFNEAFLKMHRIHKLQDSIILAYFNPQLFNESQQVFNYVIIMRANNGILFECWGKMKEGERTEATARRKALSYFLKNHPVHVEVKHQSNHQKQMKFNQSNWEIFEEHLFDYNLYMRGLLSRCGYDAPNQEDYMQGL